MAIEIEMSLPNRKLHPNGRTRNHAEMARLVRERRSLVGKYGLAHEGPPIERGYITLKYLTFSRVRPDNDGLIAWAKSTIDGLADANIISNDRNFTVSAEWQRAPSALHSKLTVVVTSDE